MRTLRLLPVFLAALVALPAAASASPDAPSCEAATVAFDGALTADDAIPAFELGSAEVADAIASGAVVLDLAEAAREDCFYVTGYIVDLDGNIIGYIGYIAPCPEEAVDQPSEVA